MLKEKWFSHISRSLPDEMLVTNIDLSMVLCIIAYSYGYCWQEGSFTYTCDQSTTSQGRNAWHSHGRCCCTRQHLMFINDSSNQRRFGFPEERAVCGNWTLCQSHVTIQMLRQEFYSSERYHKILNHCKCGLADILITDQWQHVHVRVCLYQQTYYYLLLDLIATV